MQEYTKDFANIAFQNFAIKILVYLKNGKTKNQNYDKYRDVGYTENQQNPIAIQAIIADVKPEELVFRQIGLAKLGAKKLVIKDKDLNFIKLSQKLTVNDIDYYIYDDAVGNKLQIHKGEFGYSSIVIFRKES